MPETLGSVIDRLITVNLRMWSNQEILYEIRRLSFEEFLSKYHGDIDSMKSLYDLLQKCCNINVQRNVLIDDIDKTIQDIVASKDPEVYVQDKHKTY
jgi:hypothetical protein